uniref:NADH dehydrogenase subunit 2 n=1 Tax=Chalcopis glandulosa TaxID=3021795 RepID=UPI0023AADDF3|nr:NADH dehydrogenase subunit 2 [Chalcopis glandulosa]WCB99315.1 NADH dehydrogenase subunit 2 [Chalcopis glandulosa]
MKKSKWLFMSILMLSTMITLSANSWISMWVGLEMNMMAFIPLIMSKKSKSSSEASMMYFLIQTSSSMILMMMIFIKMYSYSISNSLINTTIMICLFMKMGVAPFHLWMPEIMSKMKWSKCMLLLTWQKLAPLMMISNLNLNNSTIMNLAIISSVSIGSLGGMNQTSLRKIMGYSSINHLGWMLSIIKSMNKWMIYFFIYSIMTIIICYNMMGYNIYFMNQMSNINMNYMEKINMFMMMLSMGGLPPFIGFLPKWISIQYMISQKEMFLMFFMVMFSLITLLFYTRMMISMIMSSSFTMKWMKTNNNSYLVMLSLMINLSLPMIMFLDYM